MKTKTFATLAVFVLFTASAIMAANNNNSRVALGVRKHTSNPNFAEVKFDDDDFSYALALEWYDAGGYWQVGASYTPSPDAIDDSDYIITPQISLIFYESIWRIGVGVLKSYVNSSTKSEWSDIYWQAIAGIGLPPIGKLHLDFHASYVFEKWNRIDEFKFDDLEYSVWLGFNF